MANSEQRKVWYQKNREKVLAKVAAWAAANPERRREISRRYSANNKDKRKNTVLKYEYGITSAERDAIFDRQGQKCGLCSSSEPRGGGWVVDHNHETKAVRGVLCGNCNSGIGLLGDQASIALLAFDYLVKHGA